VKLIKTFSIVWFVFVTGGFLLPTAVADEHNNASKVIFNTSVEVPGVGLHVLPAGRYLFRLKESLSDRNIVEICNEQGTHIYTTTLTIPNYRFRATDKTVMTVQERAEGQPQALKAWFYPGTKWGREFVYPKARATELAKITQSSVLATPADLSDASVEALKTVSLDAVAPLGETADLAIVIEPPPAGVVELPATAGSSPALGLAGLLSLGIGFGLWMCFKRAAPVSSRYS